MVEPYGRAMRRELADNLRREIPGSAVLVDAPMSELTSFRIGGPVDILIEPAGREAVLRAIEWAGRNRVPTTVIGRGTNLLVRDGGIRGLVIRVGAGLDAVDLGAVDLGPVDLGAGRSSSGDSGPGAGGVVVRAEAGVAIGELARQAADRGLAGLTFACGIPGSLGGAVVMNAGAYGGEMKDVVRRVEVVGEDGAVRWLGPDALDFGYRRSALQGSGLVVLRVELGLSPGDRASLKGEMERLDRERAAHQPLEFPSAGSVFRRPEGHYVGPMITRAGLRGRRVGGAEVSEKHAGFIVNRGGATADDVLELIDRVQSAVRAKFGVDLVPEIRIIGEG